MVLESETKPKAYVYASGMTCRFALDANKKKTAIGKGQ